MKALKDYRKKVKQLQTEFLALRSAEVKVLSRRLFVFHANLRFPMQFLKVALIHLHIPLKGGMNWLFEEEKKSTTNP